MTVTWDPPTRADALHRLGSRAERPHLRASLDLLGRPGSRSKVATPALLVDLDALEHNLDLAAREAARAGVRLHPQAKAHKSAAIARLQLARGAAGISVATLAEAEALAAAGIGQLMLTSPVHAGLVDRVGALHDALGNGLTVTVDHHDCVASLAERVHGELAVLVDLDVGLHRSGVVDPAAAVRAVDRIAGASTLTFAGVQAYGGHWQHMADPWERRAAVVDGMELAAEVVGQIEHAGHAVAMRTGGGTGTFVDDCELRVLDDLQPGSYVFMDRQYADALQRDERHGWRQSLFVLSTVVSANHADWVTVDAGLKAFATDADEPTWDGGTPYAWFGDEHGILVRPVQPPIRVGDTIELTPPHCDPTVDRYDVLHLVRGDTLVDVVPIDARGCSQ